MNQTEPPSRPLLLHDEADIRVSDDEAQATSASTTAPTSLVDRKEALEKPSTRSKRVGKFPAPLIAFFVAFPRYCIRASKQCGRTLAPLGLGRWIWETCGLIFASLSLLGLFATLLAHQGKPLPQWPQIITINSIISLFSILIRAAIGVILAEGIGQSKWQWFRKARKLQEMEHFDSASRSAWGAFLLILHFNPKQPYGIAALGACITIAASLTGFAMQQLIQFDDCLQPNHNSSVRIERTNYYGAAGRRLAPYDFDYFPPMAVAMDVGILQPVQDLTNVLSHGCATGNCDFPTLQGETFSTVGINHTCEDITSQAETRVIPENATWTLKDWKVGADSYTLPNGTTQKRYVVAVDMGYTTRGESAPLLSFAMGGWPGTLVTGVTPVNESARPDIGTVKMIARPVLDIDRYWAIACSFYPTVNTYSARIRDSVLSEELVRSVPLPVNQITPEHPEWSEGQFAVSHKIGTTRTIQGGREIMCQPQGHPAPGYDPIATSNILTADFLIDESGTTNNTPVLYLPQDCVWQFRFEAIVGIHKYLNYIFGDRWLGSAPKYFNGTMQLRQLYQGGNMTLDTVNQLMGNMTRSMNTIIRTYGSDNFSDTPDAGPARGTILNTETCVHVRWSWIAFPAAIIILSGVFLIFVHIESRGIEKDRLWKSSILALLFCELDREILNDARPIRKPAITRIAKSTKVSLQKEQEVLSLKVE